MICDRPPKVSFDAIPFWQGCDREELLVQRCTSCGNASWFPRTICKTCSGTDLAWERSSGIGTVEAYSVVYRPMTEDYRDEVPYALALVNILEGPTFVTRIVGATAIETQIGDQVCVRFIDTTGHKLPVFERVTADIADSSPPPGEHSKVAVDH